MPCKMFIFPDQQSGVLPRMNEWFLAAFTCARRTWYSHSVNPHVRLAQHENRWTDCHEILCWRGLLKLVEPFIFSFTPAILTTTLLAVSHAFLQASEAKPQIFIGAKSVSGLPLHTLYPAHFFSSSLKVLDIIQQIRRCAHFRICVFKDEC